MSHSIIASQLDARANQYLRDLDNFARYREQAPLHNLVDTQRSY